MSAYLHEAAHDAVAQEELLATESHRRDDGVVWPLTALMHVDSLGTARSDTYGTYLQRVGMLRVKGEVGSTVLQREPTALRHS